MPAMKTIGFPISRKENEFRRAILPVDLRKMKHPDRCCIEKGLGEAVGVSDAEYEKAGARAVSRHEVLSKDVICNPKGLDPDMIPALRPGMTLFGWVHAVQGREITDVLLDRGMTAIAWEDMFEEGRLHVFWRNNEIAGESAVIHSARFSGRLPYEWNAAILGRGNCARGAFRILEKMGAEVVIYPKERMFLLRDEVERYDVVVNALLWDVFEKRLVLSADDIKRMKKGSMIIDVSCDSEGMCIETTHPTTIDDPVFVRDGVIHYAVDHTASLFRHSATDAISAAVAPYLDCIIEGEPNAVLDRATIIRGGRILDDRIRRFQNR
ncbi:MAG: N(5)-(carboxyethyl)ornithine synthase [Candidatus Krumholzibacteria bacterium]|nr:N(5)-(carboxyethyl)ornithine synthase [Candidatus Krumholzibacteria bacterium]